jgi:hypothetical protein
MARTRLIGIPFCYSGKKPSADAAARKSAALPGCGTNKKPGLAAGLWKLGNPE